MRSGPLYVHEPNYNTQDYGAKDHQDSLLGSHGLAQPPQNEETPRVKPLFEGRSRIKSPALAEASDG